MTDSTEIPLFPLNTVLFPRGPLPLRIFETRYVDMVKRCMREDACFGVVLVSGGSEVGQPAGYAEVGTTARIVDFNLLPDGLLGITCRGERRFRVLERRREADGLHVGSIEWLDAATPEIVRVPSEFRHLSDLLRRVLPELGDMYAGLELRHDDAEWVGARLIEILPLALEDKQSCLELMDPLERLALIAPLIKRADEEAD
jgi:Lon protease-like protein